MHVNPDTRAQKRKDADGTAWLIGPQPADGGGMGTDSVDGGKGGDDDIVMGDIARYLDVLDESIEMLTDIECDLDEESEDELVADVGLYELVDMGEHVARNARTRRAERAFLRRQQQVPDGD